MSNENNPALPETVRFEVQYHLDRLNAFMDEPLSQIDVAMGGTPALFEYRLQNGAEERVTDRLTALRRGEAVLSIRDISGNQKKGKKAESDRAALAIAMSDEVYEACKFFGVPVELESFVDIARAMQGESVEETAEVSE